MASEPGRTAKATILIADDQAEEREHLRSVLGAAGYAVLEADDGVAALAIAEREVPDLIVTDVLMPTLDGLELVRRLRSQPGTAAIRAVIRTATFREDEAKVMAEALGATRFLKKPAAPEVLLATVAAALSEPPPTPVPAAVLKALAEAHERLMSDKLVEKAAELEAEIVSRKQIEADLRASEQRFAGVVESAMDAIISVDAEQRIVLFNAAAEAMFRCPAAQALGVSIERFIPERFRLAHGGHLRRFAEAGVTSRAMGQLGHLSAVRADGEEFPIEASISKVQLGNSWRLTVIMRDITARVKTEEELRRLNQELEQRVLERTAELTRANEALLRSNQELQQFAFIASHDLQTPLRSISGFAQLLQRDYQGRLDAHADDLIRRVVNSAKRLQRLIHELLAYSRVDARAAPFRPVDFRQVFADAVANLQSSICDSGAAITRDELPTVVGDRSQLTQLLQNLLENGIKYHGSEPPRLHVAASRQGGEWVFSVRDNGIGIDARHRERIFDIFYRLHTQQAYPGTGIGLAICRRVVHRHGGRIWVESEPGQGSVFYFTLPDRG